MKFLFSCWKIFHEWVQRTSEIFSAREEKFRISKRPCNVLFIIWTPMKYQTISLKQLYPTKGAIYYVAIATVIFSDVKITCYFHVWRYHVFTQKLTWYFIGVYIINYNSDYYNNICYNCCFNKVAKRFGTLNLQVKVYQKCWKMNELYADRFQAPPPPPKKKFQGFKFHSPNIARPQRVCPVSRRKWSGLPFLKGSFAKRPCKQVGEVINRKDN